MFLAWPGLVWFLFLKRSITQVGILKKCLLSWPSLIAVSCSSEWFGQRCGRCLMIRTTSCFTATLASIKQYTENMCVVSALFRLVVWIFVEFCKLAGIRSFRSMPSSTGDSMIRQRCEVAKWCRWGIRHASCKGVSYHFLTSWLSLWIGLLLETGSFLHFVLDSATGHIKLENPLKTTAQSMVSSLPSHMPSKPISLRFGRVVILPIRYILD